MLMAHSHFAEHGQAVNGDDNASAVRAAAGHVHSFFSGHRHGDDHPRHFITGWHGTAENR